MKPCDCFLKILQLTQGRDFARKDIKRAHQDLIGKALDKGKNPEEAKKLILYLNMAYDTIIARDLSSKCKNNEPKHDCTELRGLALILRDGDDQDAGKNCQSNANELHTNQAKQEHTNRSVDNIKGLELESEQGRGVKRWSDITPAENDKHAQPQIKRIKLRNEETHLPPEDNRPAFKRNLQYIIRHYYKYKTTIKFVCKWEGYTMETHESPSEVLRFPTILRGYLNEITTRARSTLISRENRLVDTFRETGMAENTKPVDKKDLKAEGPSTPAENQQPDTGKVKEEQYSPVSSKE